MVGRLLRPCRIVRADLKANRQAMFLFGDNMQRRGLGGQAKEMRGEPNAVGVPTKWAPSNDASAFFSDEISVDAKSAIVHAFIRARLHLRRGFDVVIPRDGLGTGLADLPKRAPRVHAWIERHIAALEATGSHEAVDISRQADPAAGRMERADGRGE